MRQVLLVEYDGVELDAAGLLSNVLVNDFISIMLESEGIADWFTT